GKRQTVPEPVCVEELAGGEAAVRGGELQDSARIEVAAVRPVLVRVHRGLRTSGGSAGPQPEGGLIATGGRGGHPLRRSVRDPPLEAAIAALADDQHALQGARPGEGRLHALDAPPRSDQQARAAFLDEVGVVRRAQQRIAGHGDGADLHRGQVSGGELGRVGKDEQDALLRLASRLPSRDTTPTGFPLPSSTTASATPALESRSTAVPRSSSARSVCAGRAKARAVAVRSTAGSSNAARASRTETMPARASPS